MTRTHGRNDKNFRVRGMIDEDSAIVSRKNLNKEGVKV